MGGGYGGLWFASSVVVGANRGAFVGIRLTTLYVARLQGLSGTRIDRYLEIEIILQRKVELFQQKLPAISLYRHPGLGCLIIYSCTVGRYIALCYSAFWAIGTKWLFRLLAGCCNLALGKL